MSLLSKLFPGNQPTDEPVACPHRVLAPSWEHTEDIGHEDRATAFRCEVCGVVLSGEEGRLLLDAPLTDGCVQ